jgi:hypothetical protein
MTPAVPKVSTRTVNVEALIRNPCGRFGRGVSVEHHSKPERRLRGWLPKPPPMRRLHHSLGIRECSCERRRRMRLPWAEAKRPLNRVNRMFALRRAPEERTALLEQGRRPAGGGLGHQGGLPVRRSPQLRRDIGRLHAARSVASRPRVCACQSQEVNGAALCWRRRCARCVKAAHAWER